MEDNEKLSELFNLLKDLEGKDKASAEQLTQLFNLNNYFYPQLQEYSKSCSSCVQRVYKRMSNYMMSVLDHYNEIIKRNLEEE